MESVNSSASFKTDYDLWEYLLVVCPDAAVQEKIETEKNLFHTLHDHERAMKAKPQMVIASFLMKEPMEEIVIKWIQNICRLHAGFDVLLNNFSGFPPHTIYIRVQNLQPFKQLTNALKILDGFIQSNDCPPVHLTDRPYLAIADGLPEYIYDKAIKEYSQRSFHACFNVHKLLLLKRDASMDCHLLNTFILPPPAPRD